MHIEIEKITLWSEFKETLLKTIEEQDPFEVDLSFEFKDARGDIKSYSSGDVIYIHDVKLSGTGKLCFEIASNEENNRFIDLSYADSISNPSNLLEDLVLNTFTSVAEALNEKNKEPSLPTNLNDFLKEVKEGETSKIINILNSASEWIQKTLQEERDKKIFDSIEDFGMF